MATIFRSSFGYLTALAAVLAASSSQYVASTASALRTTPAVLVSETVLLLNLFYFTLVSGCLFAVIKRGFFILQTRQGTVDERWERFSRFSPVEDNARWTGGIGRLAWNIDNLYLLPLFGLLAGCSIAASCLSLDRSSGWPLVLATTLTALYAVPAGMLWYVVVLTRESQQFAVALTTASDSRV